MKKMTLYNTVGNEKYSHLCINEWHQVLPENIF